MYVLEVLDLSNTSMVSLPTSISELKELKQLLLKDCSALMVLPTEIGLLSKLKVLDLSNTSIVSLPTSISELKELKQLLLKDCSALTVLPTKIGMLSKLKVLDLSNTSIVSLPTSISELKELKQLLLKDCSALIVLPTEIGMLSKLKVLDLSNTSIVSLPTSISELKELKQLLLKDCSALMVLPTEIGMLSKLKVLDLSNTSIVTLPTSISELKELKQLLLKDCSALMMLPTEIGMLSKLKLFDMKGTELMLLPKEMGNLTELEVLRVSFSQYAKYYIKSNTASDRVIPNQMILQLKQLKELCVIISVGSEPDWWEEEVNHLQEHLINLKKLETLRWYLPAGELLNRFIKLERNGSPMYKTLSNLMLTIGQHAQLTSVLPRGLEKKFEEFKNSLKWINAEGNKDDISKVMACAEALFLSRHWTIKKLSTFNVPKLKYCLLSECNEMRTLVKVDETGIKNGEGSGLELLQYLSIHHMNKLHSIWKGPFGKDSLSKLTIIALHTCPQLTSIFTQTIAQNLSCLIEIVVEDCPKVESLISTKVHDVKCVGIFPSLERIFLLDLPKLVNIFCCGITLNKSSTMLIYNCLELRSLDINLPHIKKIEGEIEWWKDLNCDKSAWENVFVPLRKGRDLVEQIFEATNSLQHFHDSQSHENDEKESPNLTDIREEEHIEDTSLEGRGINLPREENDEKESPTLNDIREEEHIDDTSLEEWGINLPREDMKRQWEIESLGGSPTGLPLLKGPFIGFDSQVRDLKEVVLKDLAVDDCSVVVVSGEGSCGKTTLVTMLCHDPEVQGKFGRRIYFATISRTYDLKAIIKNLLLSNQLGMLPDFTSDEVAIHAWESFVGESKSEKLLILDDVWSDTVVMAFKFKSPTYKILVTSRITFNQFKTYQLPALNIKEATERTRPRSSMVVAGGIGLMKSVIIKATHSIIKPAKRALHFKSELKKLQETLKRMRPYLEDTGEQNREFSEGGMVTQRFIILHKAKDLIRKCEKIKWNLLKKSLYASKLKKMNESLSKLTSSGVGSSGAPLDVATGFDDRLRVLKGMVLTDSQDDDCSVLVVSAAGGCGKTTLVTMLCKDPDIKGRFGEKIYFVTISHPYDKKVTINKLLSKLPGIGITDDEPAILKWERFLGNEKSDILLVLDNVRSDSVIMDFKFKSPRYKILVTSRMTFNQFKTYQLPALNDEDAIRLFRESAFLKHGNEDHYISDDLVDKLVKCCNNHPLALSVVGSLLNGTNAANWKVMLKELSMENNQVLDFHESILYCLEKSLDFFDKDTGIKQCYMDLVLFPEDQKIAGTALQEIWAHLYHHDEDGLTTTKTLTNLSSRSLATLVPERNNLPTITHHLEEAFVTQHDMMRELAIHLSSKDSIEHRERLIINTDGQGLPQLPQSVNARIFSISTDERFPFTWNKIQAPQVEVLVLNFTSSMHPLPQFMENMGSLKVLLITNYGYYFSEIQNFPAPQYLTGLTKIRLDHVSISSISTTILMLENLQKLSLIMCKIGNSFNEGISNKLTSLSEIDIDSCDDLVTFPAMLCNVISLKKLSITNCHELTSVSEEFGKLSNLEVFRLTSCTNLPMLPESTRHLKKLRIVDLHHCLSLRELPQHIGELNNLETINLMGCTGLISQHEMPKLVKKFDKVKVVCDEEISHLWSDFNNVEIEVASIM